MERYAARWPSGAAARRRARRPHAGDRRDAAAAVHRAHARVPVLPGRGVRAGAAATPTAAAGDWSTWPSARGRRVSTAEILQPERWLRARAAAARVAGSRAGRALRAAAGGGWPARRSARRTSPRCSRRRADRSRRAELTAGWRGGRYALWRRGPLAARAARRRAARATRCRAGGADARRRRTPSRSARCVAAAGAAARAAARVAARRTAVRVRGARRCASRSRRSRRSRGGSPR